MDAYIRRSRMIFIVVVLFSMLVTPLGVYLPMKNEIELNMLTYFNLLSETKIDSFTVTIDKYIQAAKSLSSRSAIRDKAVEYLSGDISFEDLTDFTTSKYLDGVAVINNLVCAKRIVDCQIVVSFNSTGNNCVVSDYTDLKELTYCYIIRDGIALFEVVSPITADEKLVGYDVVDFSLESTIASLNDDSPVSFELTQDTIDIDKLDEFDNLYENMSYVYFIERINDSYDIVISLTKADLFQSLHTLTKRIVAFLIASYFIIFITIYLFIIKYAKKQIRNLSTARDTFKKHADVDTLTGANSRHYFENFISSHPYEKGTLIMIDLDDFKNINDIYGHVIGDEALKTTASAIRHTIRNDDLIIRYGGDEFLILLRMDSQSHGLEIINRIKTTLSKQRPFQFEIDFSFGIVHVDSLMNINDHISQADKLMYQNKQEKHK